VELNLSGLHHLDHACRTALENWAERHSTSGTEPVRMTAVGEGDPPELRTGSSQD
ncbi:hypothetical protein G6W54_30585, partial [Streptomyces sp. CAI-78]|nr:hypothetical protein [Streptomyces sp. CAI-78]